MDALRALMLAEGISQYGIGLDLLIMMLATAILVLMILHELGINITPVLASAGVIGLATRVT